MPTVRVSRVIRAPIKDVWSVIRDFAAHGSWIEHNPTITLEGPMRSAPRGGANGSMGSARAFSSRVL